VTVDIDTSGKHGLDGLEVTLMPSVNMGDYIEGLESNDGNDAEKILGWNLIHIFRINE